MRASILLVACCLALVAGEAFAQYGNPYGPYGGAGCGPRNRAYYPNTAYDDPYFAGDGYGGATPFQPHICQPAPLPPACQPHICQPVPRIGYRPVVPVAPVPYGVCAPPPVCRPIVPVPPVVMPIYPPLGPPVALPPPGYGAWVR